MKNIKKQGHFFKGFAHWLFFYLDKRYIHKTLPEENFHKPSFYLSEFHL